MARSGAIEYIPVMFDYIALQSPAAVKVCYGGRELWLPKSTIHESDLPVVPGTEPEELHVAAWLAKKEGLT